MALIYGKEISLRSFYWVTGIWVALGMAYQIHLAQLSGQFHGLILFTWIVFLAAGNLFFLMKTIEVTFDLMSDRVAVNKTHSAFLLLIRGSLKFLFFLGIFASLYLYREHLNAGTLVTVVGLFIIVPLLGGFLFVRRES